MNALRWDVKRGTGLSGIRGFFVLLTHIFCFINVKPFWNDMLEANHMVFVAWKIREWTPSPSRDHFIGMGLSCSLGCFAKGNLRKLWESVCLGPLVRLVGQVGLARLSPPSWFSQLPSLYPDPEHFFLRVQTGSAHDPFFLPHCPKRMNDLSVFALVTGVRAKAALFSPSNWQYLAI